MLNILNSYTSSISYNTISILYSILLSFLLSTIIAITYEKTFRGLSYSRNFVQALVLSSIIAAMVMQAIGDSLASGLGMLGALAIIRFRTNFKDPRDIIFMFASLGAGIACGVFGYDIAIIGTVIFCVVAFVLYYSPLGQTNYFDGMLRFNIAKDSQNKLLLEDIFKEFCKTSALITLRDMEHGKRLSYAYQIKFKKGKNKTDIINALKAIDSIRDINILLQETNIEL